MGSPVLDISTLAPERATIRIKSQEYPEGRLYELANAEDLSLSDQQFLYSNGLRLDALVKRRSELDQDEKDELNLIVDRMVALVVPELPESIRDRIGGMDKVKVVEVFITASPGLAKQVAEAQAQMSATTPTTES